MKTMEQAREYASRIEQAMADHCLEDGYGLADHVTYEDKLKYRAKCLQDVEDIKAGKLDHIFTIAQRMEYFLTGECKPLLPK